MSRGNEKKLNLKMCGGSSFLERFFLTQSTAVHFRLRRILISF